MLKVFQKYDTPEDFVVKLKKLIKKIESTYHRFDTCEISRSQARVLFPIVKDGVGYSMQELSERMGIDKALVSRAIADLETKGFVERDKRADSNERNYKIILSAKGEEFHAKQMKKVEKVSFEWLNGVKQDELLVFLSVLNRLTEK